jgi:hypothetical protein
VPQESKDRRVETVDESGHRLGITRRDLFRQFAIFHT